MRLKDKETFIKVVGSAAFILFFMLFFATMRPVWNWGMFVTFAITLLNSVNSIHTIMKSAFIYMNAMTFVGILYILINTYNSLSTLEILQTIILYILVYTVIETIVYIGVFFLCILLKKQEEA